MNTQTTRLYVLVRKELGDRQFVAHFGHAAREAGYTTTGLVPSEDESIVVLRCTKNQMLSVYEGLQKLGIEAKRCVETEGPMAGSTPSMGFTILETKRELVDPLVKDLKPWSAPAAAVAEEELVDKLFAAIKHGDEKHQQWLRQALEDFFAGRPVVRP